MMNRAATSKSIAFNLQARWVGAYFTRLASFFGLKKLTRLSAAVW